MKAKYIIMSLAAAAVALSSCDDLLNIPQHGVQNYETYYQTDEEAEAAIVACYLQAQGNSYNALLGKNMLTEDFWAGGASRADNADLEQLNEFTFATDQGQLQGMFQAYYGIIYKANVVLGHIPEGSEIQLRARAEAKGLNRTFRFMIAGIPNTGKSTIVNLLSGQKRAKTGDKAGVTRDVRWLRCGAFDLLDTPGTMPPSFENQYHARHLAYIGSINDDILDMDDIALELLGELATLYPEYLTERYGITDFSEKLGMYEALCKRRGFILRGGEFDYERGAKALIDDFRKGRIGRICLENAEDYADFEI